MSSLATANGKVPQLGIFALGLVAGVAFALTTEIPVAAVMVLFAVIFAIDQYRRQ